MDTACRAALLLYALSEDTVRLDTDPMDTTEYLLEDQRRMSAAKNYFAWQGRLVREELGQRVLEVGCGTGNFTGALLDREAVIAVDAEADCVERLKQRYANQPNLFAFACAVGSPLFGALASFRPDCCVCLNVLEHIEDDLGALIAMASVLPPGGTIVLIVPAFPALYGPIDKNLSHCRRYTRSSLAGVVARAGLRVTKMHYMNAIGFFGWWANARLFRSEINSEAQIAFFDRWIVPPLSSLESLIHPPIGQSLFAVLRKP